MQISPHFSLAELSASDTAKRLKLDNRPKGADLDRLILTADRMEKVREVLGNKPIVVTSGYRSQAVNKAVGGVPNSDHVQGFAVDFKCPGFGSPYLIVAMLVDAGIKFDQIIHEKRAWVHIGFSPEMRGEVLTLMPGARTYLKGLHK